MTKLAAALTCALAALTFAGPAGATDFGVTEDMGKGAPQWILETIHDLGMTRNVVSLTFDPEQPEVLPQADEIDRLVEAAPRYDVEIVFAVYARRPTALTSVANVAAFSTWLATAARRWPTVTTWIGPNEPNQPRFWQPQFTPGCGNASAASYFRVQAAMYDSLKTVSRVNQVIGVALSPRGNDNCRAASNVSTSPVRFLRALGLAMRASRRNRPIMDALSQHPYPNVNTDAPTKGYPWPKIGVPNMDRLKQAFWDAFAGTAQPTFEQGLQVHLDEVGWQTNSEGDGYQGSENVPTVPEATQGRYYAQIVRLVTCDPAVASLDLFHLVDEFDRDRFQSGLLWSDGTRKSSFEPVQAAIAAAREQGCTGVPVAWRHATSVLGAKATFPSRLTGVRRRSLTFRVTATEDATFTAGVFPASAAGSTIGRRLAGVRTASPGVHGLVRAYRSPPVTVRSAVVPGRYVYAVRLAAATNPARTSLLVSKPFTVR